MPTFKVPPSIRPRIEAYAGLVVAEYLWQAAEIEKVSSLAAALNYVATEIFEAARKDLPRIKGEHLREQTEACALEMLQGRDRILEETFEIMEQMQAEVDQEDNFSEEKSIDEEGEEWKSDEEPEP
jgi:hypothetical protein